MSSREQLEKIKQDPDLIFSFINNHNDGAHLDIPYKKLPTDETAIESRLNIVLTTLLQ